MQIDGHIKRVGPLQDRREELVVEIAATSMPIDERALEALLAHPPLQLCGCLIRHRQRQCCECGEARGMFFYCLGEKIVGFNRTRYLLCWLGLLDARRVE